MAEVMAICAIYETWLLGPSRYNERTYLIFSFPHKSTKPLQIHDYDKPRVGTHPTLYSYTISNQYA